MDKTIDHKPENLLLKAKKDAKRIFDSLPMPSPKLEAWRYTEIESLDLGSFQESKQEVSFDFPKEAKEKGVIFCDLKHAIKEHFDIISKNMPMGLCNVSEDKFMAMHAANLEEGVFIYVPKNIELTLPLQNVFKIKGNGVVFSHTLIVLDTGSSLSYVEEHGSKEGDYAALRNDITEVYSKPNSKLEYYRLQSWKENVTGITSWKGNLENDSKIDWIFAEFGGKLSRLKIDTFFSGSGSESTVNGIFFADNKKHFDITTDAYHNARGTTNNILVKGALNDNSTSVYRGKIKIDKIAQQTNSYLSDHSLLLGDGTISNSIPSLEIDANDVKASHGATIGKPDDEEIFYLMARGLARKEAEKLLITGYFSEITQKIKIEELKEKIESMLEEKYLR
jgi:Fe-S cluster assembly protein SufD